jgi:hypothetical protein
VEGDERHTHLQHAKRTKTNPDNASYGRQMIMYSARCQVTCEVRRMNWGSSDTSHRT